MGLLLYSSNEMFSSTELIRKSKLIFDKILSNEIEKAIILRDGKPSFLLMEFTKYEKIMAEYEQLKRYVQKQKAKQQKAKTIKTPDIPLAQEEQQQDIIQKIEEETQEVETTQETKEVQEEIEKTKEVQKTQETQEETQTKELTQEEEIQEAFKNIEHLNFDEKMKKIAQDKIRQKIILARQERERQKEQERLEQEEQERIEQEKLQQIQEETQKKQQELQEFWD